MLGTPAREGSAAAGGGASPGSGGASPGRTGDPVELEPGLRSLLAPNPGPLTLDGTRTYLLGGHELVVLDPGPALPGHVDRLLAAVAGERVVAVCLTHAHADHAGSAPEVAAALGAPLVAGSGTLERLAVPGKPLEDGGELALDGGDSRLRAVATPGHSRDHTCYLWLPGRRLFSGDLVLGEGSSLIAHPEGSVADCLASLDRLLALRPSRLLPGHGPPVDAAVARLEEYRLHRLERDRQVREAVLAGATTVAEIERHVYGSLPPELEHAARLSVLAHLAHVRETGGALPRSLADALGRLGVPGPEREAG